MAKGLTDAQLDAMDEMEARQNLYGTAARVLESPDAAPMTDAQMNQRATSDSVMQATPFGQATMPQSAPQPPQADFREPPKPLTDAELNAQEDNLYYDPAYEMPFEEFAPVHARRQQEKNTVGSFVDGAVAAGQGLVSLTAEMGGELRDNFTSNLFRPDRFATQNFVTLKEAGRKAGLEFAKLVDWIGNTARDHATDVRRQEQVRSVIAQKLQAEGKLSGDLRGDIEIINREFAAAKERGETAPTPLEENADVEQAFEDYRRGKNFDREIAGVGNFSIGQTPVTQESSEARATNSFTGEVMEPQRALATGGAMAFAPDNLLPVGAGVMSKVRILRRLSSITGVPLKMTENVANAGANALQRGAMRITDKVQDLTGMNAMQQTAAATALTGGVGYLSTQGQGAPAALGGVATGVLSILPIMKFGGAILRRTGATAGGGYAIVREMGAGGAGAAGAEAAEAMAKSGVFPQRYARHMQPGGASADSTLRRVAQDPENPQMLRRLSRTANNLGATQAFRLTDDVVSSAAVSGLAAAPFALVAPDAEQGGQIVGGALMLGTLAGTATRTFGRRPAEVDADIARMLVDVTESNGDAASLMSLSHDSLSQLAAMQGVLRNKVKFIPLRGQDYRANADLRAAGGETAAGLYIEKDANGSARIFVNMGHTAPVDGKVSVRPDVDKGGNVIDITAADGTVDSTHVPQGIRLLVKTGDAVSANQRLAQDLSPTRIVPHEIGHAILTSDILDGQPRNDLRNLVNQQYATDGVAARGREYATRLVDKDILVGAIEDAPVNLTDAQINDISSGKTTLADVLKGQPVSEQARQRLIDQRVEELSQRSIEKGQDPLDWARDEIIAETFASEAPAIDFRAIRRDALFPRLAESMLSAGGRVLEVMGARLDPGTGKLMDNPSVLFRDNPLFQDRIMQKRVREYVRSYDQYLAGLEEAGAKELRGVELARSSKPEDLARSTHVKLRDEGNGVLENDFMVQRPDGTYTMKAQKTVNLTENARSAQIKTLYDARKFVPVNSQEFGKRKVNGREVVGGPVLPKQFDFFTNFPKYLRPDPTTGDIGLVRKIEASREDGGSWDIDVNVIGTGSSGRYRVINLGNTRAVQRETVPYGWIISKANHLLAASLDLNSFRGSAMKAINKGDLGLFNNDMRQVEADLKTYLANHRNGRPGEMTIGQQKRDMLNGLIGTGTAVQRTANPLYSDLNPRGSIRTWRVDRLNDAKPTGRTGYFFDYDKINNNRMPSALPQTGMAMPDGPVGPREATITQDGLVQAPEDAPTFKLPRRAMAQFMPDTGIRLEDYADRPIVALPADRMGIGQMRVGPKGSEQILSVPGQGGAGFMEIYNGGGWAFTDTPTADRFLGRLREVARPGDTSVIVGITALNEVNHLKNQTGQLAYVEALEAAIKNKSVSRKQADAHIREIAKRIYTSEASPKALTQSTRDKFKAMRSFDDFQKAVRAKSLNFADAAWLLKKMQQKALPLPYKDAQAIGIAFDDVARQTADPRYADVPFGTVVALLEVPINQSPSRNPFHYAYPAKVEGNRIGFLSKFQNIDDLTSDPRIRNKQGRVTAQPLQTVLPVMDRIGQSPRGQAMPDVADIDSSTSVSALQKHPMFKSAKYDGSAKAAFDIVESLVKPKAIQDVMSKIDPSRPAYIIPVIAREGDSANMLPLAMAEKLSAATGIPIWAKLAKTSSQHNTGAGADSRARTMHRWEGEAPPAGSQIVLVDDTYTTGQTLRSLASVVGDPDAVATISVGRYTKQFTLQPDREQKLLAKAGLTKQQFINLYGSEPKQALTGAQAQQYLLNGARGEQGLLARFPVERGGFSTQAIAGLTQLPEGVTTFSGGGLVEIGLRGIVRPTVAVEYSPAIAQAYRAAHGDHVKVQDIRTVSLEDHKGKFHYHASPVCKNSSLLKSAALGGGEKDLDIESAQAVARHIDQIEPKVVTIENVPDYAKTEAADIIRKKLQERGYTVDENVYNAAKFGAPTARRRYLLRAVKDGVLPEPVAQDGPGWYSTVVDLIETLPDDSIARAQYIYRSLREQGVDPDNVTEPLLVSGTTLFKKVAFARPDQPAFTFKATPATVDRILLPGGRVKRVTARAKARMTGIPDDYPLPKDEKTALTIIGNGVPPALVRNVFGPVIEANK
jgi:site-specific DNA-cytosine methylase